MSNRFSFFSIIELRFFNTALADIYRAIRGGSLMGAFVQSVCVIDAMAYLRNALPGKGTRLNYEKWVTDWMNPLNVECQGDILYALRCGLVHTYGYAEQMNRLGIKGFSHVHNHPELHWAQQKQGIYTLNLDSHLAEVTVAAWTFFESLKELCAAGEIQWRSLKSRAEKLLNVKDYLEVPLSDDLILRAGPFIPTKQSFAKMDPALKCLDESTRPKVDGVAQAIRQIYELDG